MKYGHSPIALVLQALCTLNSQLSTAQAQGTAFTYEGHLQNNGSPVNGTYDLAFSLFATAQGGTACAGPVIHSGTELSNGLFSVTLNFGAGVFTGPNDWLDFSVSPSGSNTFAGWSPRQPLLATPYAMMANSAGNLPTNEKKALLIWGRPVCLPDPT